MRNLVVVLVAMFSMALMSAQTKGQVLYGGFTQGMSKDEVKQEFKKNKADYQQIDFGYNFKWKVRYKYVTYDEFGGLSAVNLFPEGGDMGLTYDTARQYIERGRNYLEDAGYEVIYAHKWWNAPINMATSGYPFQLLLINRDKNIGVMLNTGKYDSIYFTTLVVIDGKLLEESFNKYNEINQATETKF